MGERLNNFKKRKKKSNLWAIHQQYEDIISSTSLGSQLRKPSPEYHQRKMKKVVVAQPGSDTFWFLPGVCISRREPQLCPWPECSAWKLLYPWRPEADARRQSLQLPGPLWQRDTTWKTVGKSINKGREKNHIKIFITGVFFSKRGGGSGTLASIVFCGGEKRFCQNQTKWKIEESAFTRQDRAHRPPQKKTCQTTPSDCLLNSLSYNFIDHERWHELRSNHYFQLHWETNIWL